MKLAVLIVNTSELLLALLTLLLVIGVVLAIRIYLRLRDRSNERERFMAEMYMRLQHSEQPSEVAKRLEAIIDMSGDQIHNLADRYADVKWSDDTKFQEAKSKNEFIKSFHEISREPRQKQENYEGLKELDKYLTKHFERLNSTRQYSDEMLKLYHALCNQIVEFRATTLLPATMGQVDKARQGMQALWSSYYGDSQSYREEKVGELVEEAGRAISLCCILGSQFDNRGITIAKTTEYTIGVVDGLDEIRKDYLNELMPQPVAIDQIVDGIKIILQDDEGKIQRLSKIDHKVEVTFDSLASYLRHDEDVFDAASRLNRERKSALQSLAKYYNADNESLPDAMGWVISQLDSITGKIQEAMPNANGSVVQMVDYLADAYLMSKPEVEKAHNLEYEQDGLKAKLELAQSEIKASRALAEEIAQQLNFNTSRLADHSQPVNLMLGQLLKEKKQSVYRQLRMELSAALIALDEVLERGGQGEQKDVIEALNIGRLRRGLKELLAEMEEFSGRELWEKGLRSGVNPVRLNDLLRADTLLHAYFADQKEFDLLRSSISKASAAMQAVLNEFNVEVVKIDLFEPLLSGVEMEPVYPHVRNLRAVRDKVREKLISTSTGVFVVDVISFPLRVDGVQINRGRAAVVNPSAFLRG